MSSDNKRCASSPASGEVIKRARKDLSKGLNGDSLSVSPPPNRLLELPREIRDEVHAYAFGHGQLYLTHGALEISATHPDEATFREPGKCGLPPWMLSSKQMCSEALAVIGDAQEFSPNSPYSYSQHIFAGRQQINSVFRQDTTVVQPRQLIFGGNALC
jgi:hypothetical protein